MNTARSRSHVTYFLVVITKYLLGNLWVEELVWAVLEDRVDHSRQMWWLEQVAGLTVSQSGSRESWVLLLSSLSPSVQPGALHVEWHQPNPGWAFTSVHLFQKHSHRHALRLFS